MDGPRLPPNRPGGIALLLICAAAPLAAAEDPVCARFAQEALRQAQESQRLKTGFKPPVWSTDYKMFYNWCQANRQNRQKTPGTLGQREKALQNFVIRRGLKACERYSRVAVQLAKDNADLGTGLKGPAWQPDYKMHLAWCNIGRNLRTTPGQLATRATNLQKSVLANPPPANPLNQTLKVHKPLKVQQPAKTTQPRLGATRIKPARTAISPGSQAAGKEQGKKIKPITVLKPVRISPALSAGQSALAGFSSQKHPAFSRKGRLHKVTYSLSGNRPAELTFEDIDGWAVYQGDMILGRTQDLLNPPPPTQQDDAPSESGSMIGTRRSPLSAVAHRNLLWPNANIPFEIGGGFSANMRNTINQAVGHLNTTTNLNLVPRQGQSDYVRIRHRSQGCSSQVGRQGGRQHVNLADGCNNMGVIAHELLHSAGMWHEQSRNDRDNYVEILWDHIQNDREHNFEKQAEGEGLDLGTYDFGSLMHYWSGAFGRTDASGARMQTIRPLSPLPAGVVMGQTAGLSAGDIAGVNQLYPVVVSLSGGQGWGSGNYATCIAFGDVDGDGRDEVGITRRTTANSRVWILDDAASGYRVLWETGRNWGKNNYATSIAFGDVDGDGRDEVGFTRRSTSNARYWILDDAGAGFRVLHDGGNRWGSGNYATGIAFGDVDGDGRAEVGLARRATGNARYWIFDDANSGFNTLHEGGTNWGSGNYATGIAFGDVDGDGLAEVGISRKARQNARYFILRRSGGSFRTLHEGGNKWGKDYYATSIAFGNIDDDARAEVGVTRYARSNMRYTILDDHAANFRRLHNGGNNWGSGNYATRIAFGDVDGDGRDEIGLSRKARGNARYWLLDDGRNYFLTIEAGGYRWGSDNYATSIAFGDVNGDRRADLGLTRKATGNMRYIVLEVRP